MTAGPVKNVIRRSQQYCTAGRRYSTDHSIPTHCKAPASVDLCIPITSKNNLRVSISHTVHMRMLQHCHNVQLHVRAVNAHLYE